MIMTTLMGPGFFMFFRRSVEVPDGSSGAASGLGREDKRINYRPLIDAKLLDDDRDLLDLMILDGF